MQQLEIVRATFANGRKHFAICLPSQVYALAGDLHGGIVDVKVIDPKKREPKAVLVAARLEFKIGRCRDERKARRMRARVRRILAPLTCSFWWVREQANRLRDHLRRDAQSRRFPLTEEQWISDLTWQTRRRPEFGWTPEGAAVVSGAAS